MALIFARTTVSGLPKWIAILTGKLFWSFLFMSQALPLRRATVDPSKRAGTARGFHLLNSVVHILLLARSLRHRTKGCSHLSVSLCRMGGRVVTDVCCVNLFCSLLSSLVFVLLFFFNLKCSVFCSHIHIHIHTHTHTHTQRTRVLSVLRVSAVFLV